MTVIRTPISLNWLIKRRARIDGARKQAICEHHNLIEKANSLRDELKQASAMADQREHELKQLIAYYDNALKSLDDVLCLHEVQISIPLIKSVKENTSAAAMGRGEMTRLIFQCLRNAVGSAVSTTDIAQFAWESTKTNRIVNFDEFRFRVRKRLGVLAWEGRIFNANKDRGVEGFWLLQVDAK